MQIHANSLAPFKLGHRRFLHKTFPRWFPIFQINVCCFRFVTDWSRVKISMQNRKWMKMTCNAKPELMRSSAPAGTARAHPQSNRSYFGGSRFWHTSKQSDLADFVDGLHRLHRLYPYIPVVPRSISSSQKIGAHATADLCEESLRVSANQAIIEFVAGLSAVHYRW